MAMGLMLAALLAGCPHKPDRASQEHASRERAVAQTADVEHVHKPPPPKSRPLPPQRVVEPVTDDAPPSPPQSAH